MRNIFSTKPAEKDFTGPDSSVRLPELKLQKDLLTIGEGWGQRSLYRDRPEQFPEFNLRLQLGLRSLSLIPMQTMQLPFWLGTIMRNKLDARFIDIETTRRQPGFDSSFS